MRLDGQVAVVTGGASGIGRGIAEVLAQAGAKIVIGDLQSADGAIAAIRAAGGTAVQVEMDTSDRESVDALMAEAISSFGKLSVLVNNAGIDAPDGNVYDLPVKDWQRTIDVNLTGVFHCSQAAIAQMHIGGSIVNISSHSSWIGTPGQSPAYNASKAGVIGLTMAMAAQLVERNIRVNAVAPAAVRSRDFGWTPDENAAHEQMYPLGLGEPHDVGYLVRYLASPAAKWVTGSIFGISGGFGRGGVIF